MKSKVNDMSDYPIVYAAMNKNDEIRNGSSSGGIFFLIAKYVIECGGVVFGAKYSEIWSVEHGFTESLNGIRDFMGSKYVQSAIKNSYLKTKEFLGQGRLVLFSGTPCQIYGLKTFLGEPYKNLITVDLICHGVSSRLVWRKYLEYRARKKKIVNVNFRDKTEGWLDFSLKIDFENGDTYRKNQHEDLYIRGFLQDIYLRPACYECKFKGIRRESDITLGDLWGCSEIQPEMFDNRGTSLVFIQSENGMKIWDNLREQMKSKRITDNNYQKYNPNILRSISPNKKREKLFHDVSIANMYRFSKNMGILRKVLGKGKIVVRRLMKKRV